MMQRDVTALSEQMKYAELHCKSNFSFLTGASHPEELISQAEELGFCSLALTDECSLAGIIKAHTEIKEKQLNIKLIVGSEFSLGNQKFTLLCPDRQAYAELSALITKTRMRAPKGEYRLEPEDLRDIRRCFCIWYPARTKIIENRPFANFLGNIFHQRLWLGAERLLLPAEQGYIDHIEQLSATLNRPIVCSNDVHFHDKQRKPVQDILTAIRLSKKLEECGVLLHQNSEQCLKAKSTLARLYPEHWIKETIAISKRCSFNLNTLKYEYPQELVPEGLTASEYLRELVEKGKKIRFPNGISTEVERTIEKELLLIKEQEYEFFFITIYDIVQYAKSQDILYQGRGSAANSVVCFCLEISAVNPDKINVLFERFISKERNEPPDIDVDFEHQRREEIFQYIYRKYGRERAAIAATVICYRFKSAFRDVARALGIGELHIDHYIKNLNHRDKGLDKREQLETLGMDIHSPISKLLFQLVDQIQGFPRHLSQHVGGFVISSGRASISAD